MPRHPVLPHQGWNSIPVRPCVEGHLDRISCPRMHLLHVELVCLLLQLLDLAALLELLLRLQVLDLALLVCCLNLIEGRRGQSEVSPHNHS